MKKTSTEKQLRVFNARRRRGDIGRISKETGFSTSYVSKVVNGLQENESISYTAYRISRRRLTNSEVEFDA